MTKDETEGLSLLQRYADDPNGRAILRRMADSIEVANRRARLYWTPTVRKSKGWTVNLRISRVFAITLRDDKVEIALVAESVDPAAMTTLIAAGDYCGSFVQEPGSERYALDWAEAAEQWKSFERAHHEMLEYEGTDSKIRNPEAHAVIDFLKSTLDRDLPYPERELSAPLPLAVGRDGSRMELLDAFAASQPGRAILRAIARSIEAANEAGRGHWGTTLAPGATYVALNVGNACAIRFHPDKVRILLLPDLLESSVRTALEEKALHLWDRAAIPGSSNYELKWSDAAHMWESLEGAHHAVLAARPSRRTAFYRSHSNDVIDFLNRTLALELPYPDYGVDAGEADSTPSGATEGSSRVGPEFGALVQFIEAKGLRFPTETLANYVLALQAKRFAILTGISGTGKTQIAMAVARSFQAKIRDRQVGELDESATLDDTVQMTARPYHFKYRQIVLPAAFVAGIDHDRLLDPDPDSNSGTIALSYPGGLTRLGFWRDPNPTRNVTWLMFARAHDFRDWYLENLQPGDQFYISVREGETPDDHRIEFRLGETEVAERRLDNRVVVPVRPDWVDNRGLLGYFNPLSNEYSTTPFLSLLLEARAEEKRAEKEERDAHPFFVVLDEMNLARVEHYFSDFLSALESGEPIPLHESEEVEEGRTESGAVVPRQLRVPSNVFFTGTVNVDETTYMFSPKVLDRAFTIEFDRVDLDGYTTGTHADREAGLSLDGGDGGLRLTPYRKPGRDDWRKFSKLDGGRLHRTLLELHGILEEEHRHFGYRVANEIARFVNLSHEQSTDGEAAAEAAFDLALLQKVLPKFHGTQQELEPILRRLASALGATSSDSSEDVPAGTSVAGLEPGTETNVEGRTTRFPRTVAKIRRMLKRLEQRGFAGFIE
ncbi:MAG: hypothetical protein F4164_00600 [Gemmatimonadales bacterium]|nr:hypothetical protein [Gemmatimonadales bacterium]MYG47876.1 hypothetical protein [Gemmatimonadales bacterium]MYK03336.1 hypothetical protein [Candidatus Palauibacter ramosifaciens]